jgi:hypothetical protein
MREHHECAGTLQTKDPWEFEIRALQFSERRAFTTALEAAKKNDNIAE